MPSRHFPARPHATLFTFAALTALWLQTPAHPQSALPDGAAAPAKPTHPSPLEADEERATFSLPPGFEIELVAKEEPGVGKFVPLAFDQKGRLWTTTAFEYPVDGNENAAQAKALYENPGKDKVLVFDTPFAPGPQKPRVFAEGLAIPLGVLPYKDGCYVQHGPDIVFLRDTDHDGRADKREVILTGFGVQDSHLFPHQFMRAPGGWIWMAQGAFNYGKVRRPDDPPEKAVQFDQTRMAKFRPDGSQFTITSNGPCNIWGLVLNGEGEAFIQEANDFGYPVMPFHEFGNYPGCSDRQWKSYAPEFPGTAPDFRMGGTGLSGLALTDKAGPFPEPWRDFMLVANPITNRIQSIKMHRDGSRWRLEKLPDFVLSSDEWFRPVAISIGPDGCLYIVDWYNKVISHNEVPRTHPDRDKSRGRIWRVRPIASKPFDVPDFTQLSGEDLMGKLGGPSVVQSHLAWQTIVDGGMSQLSPKLRKVLADDAGKSESTRIAALWALDELNELSPSPDFSVSLLASSANRNVRRELANVLSRNREGIEPIHRVNILSKLLSDSDAEVAAAAIRSYEGLISENGRLSASSVTDLLRRDLAPLAEPVGPSTRDGKRIKVREAYEREFQRYLTRLLLERVATGLPTFLDSREAENLPIESRLLAALALEPRASAPRVATLLPQLTRPPEQDEVLRLAEFPEEPGVSDALRATLLNATTRRGVVEALLATRTKLDAQRLTAILSQAAQRLLATNEAAAVEQGVRLVGAFKLATLEPAIVELLRRAGENAAPAGKSALPLFINALSELGSEHTELFAGIAGASTRDPATREAALIALVSSRSGDAGERLFKLWPGLSAAQRRIALDKLSTSKAGARAIVTAAATGTLPEAAVDSAMLDRLVALLGEADPALATLVEKLGTLFKPVLTLDGKDEAWSETNLTLEGPFTVETWVKLDEGITNADGILGAPGQLDLNFHDSHFRVWAGADVNDVAVGRKKIVPGMWTHVAATRSGDGEWKLYMDGELDGTSSKRAGQKIENVRIAWTGAPGGTKGALAGYRIWNRERSAGEIRGNFDREISQTADRSLVFTSNGAAWGTLRAGAAVTKTSDLPPLLSADQATQLAEKFERYSALAGKGGDIERGKAAATVCRACHLMGTEGGQIAPNLSGVGAMGTEAILRNILTPNAAMESAYRIFRVEQRDGTILDAFYLSEDKDAMVVRLPGAADQRIPKKEIIRTQFLRRSLMPEGLLDGMQPDQVSDLFAYLKSLK